MGYQEIGTAECGCPIVKTTNELGAGTIGPAHKEGCEYYGHRPSRHMSGSVDGNGGVGGGKMIWISVKDKLPDKRQWVIVYFEQYKRKYFEMYLVPHLLTGMMVLEYLGNREFSGEYNDRDITHWMPTPDPPWKNEFKAMREEIK